MAEAGSGSEDILFYGGLAAACYFLYLQIKGKKDPSKNPPKNPSKDPPKSPPSKQPPAKKPPTLKVLPFEPFQSKTLGPADGPNVFKHLNPPTLKIFPPPKAKIGPLPPPVDMRDPKTQSPLFQVCGEIGSDYRVQPCQWSSNAAWVTSETVCKMWNNGSNPPTFEMFLSNYPFMQWNNPLRIQGP